MQKSIFGHKILQEHATTIQLALLSYIFIALSRDTPLAHICRIWSDGHMAINGHKWPYGHIWPYGHRPNAKKIWTSEVSLERAIKMQLSSANQMVIACSYKILWPKNDFCIFWPRFQSVKRAFSSKWWPSEENAKKIIFFCRNGLYPCWYKIYQEAMRF